MEKQELLYEGKAKKVYATRDPKLLIVAYKDDATAFNGQKKGTIQGKGAINNRMTNLLMARLEREDIPTHLVEELNGRETLVKRVSIVPLEVIVRNIAAGSFSKRYGVEEGVVFEQPTFELSYKNDGLGDPCSTTTTPLPWGWPAGRSWRSFENTPWPSTGCWGRSGGPAASSWWTSRWSLAGWGTGPLCWPMRSAPTPAACGTRRPKKSWTRTGSAGTWAVWRKPTSE